MFIRYLGIVVLLGVASPAVGQTDRSFPACPSQQTLEQVVGSQGRFVPDDCRKLTITPVQSGANQLCVLDFARDSDPGFLEQLKRAAVPHQWWVSCENLSQR